MEANPRCNQHKGRKVKPFCQTCNRIELEKEIVIRTVDALLKAGYALKTDAEGEDHKPFTTVRQTILKRMMDVDDEHLIAHKEGSLLDHSWVRFVYGNDGWDVISDYTSDLDGVLAPVNAYTDSIAP